MSVSYPYFSISQRLGIPYALVLSVLEKFERGLEPLDDLSSEVRSAWMQERRRRKQVLSGEG